MFDTDDQEQQEKHALKLQMAFSVVVIISVLAVLAGIVYLAVVSFS